MIGQVIDHLGVKRVLNWQPSLPTRHPAFVMERQGRAAIAGFPAFMSLLTDMPPVRDQKDLGACTAFSAEAPLHVAQVRAKRPIIIAPAPMFIYYNERRLNGQVGVDSGAAISDIFRATNKFGICDEGLWPYDTSKFADSPPQDVYDKAALVKAHIYAPVPLTRMDIIGCIHHGFPIDFGITVYSSFMGAKVAATGVVPMPADSDNVEGGHAIDIIGYNDQSQENAGIPGLHVVFRNSWSDQWGADGYGFLPYDYVIGGQYASDGWMIRTI